MVRNDKPSSEGFTFYKIKNPNMSAGENKKEKE